MTPESVSFLICSAILGLISYSIVRKRDARYSPLPPGPSALPLIGNIFRFPKVDAWERLVQYKIKYGDMIYLSGLGNSILVLNSADAIYDLLDKRGHNYSNRPELPLAGELMGLNRSTVFMTYGEELKIHRKLAHMALNPTAVKMYHSIQEDFALWLCNDLLHRPEDFYSLVRLTLGKIVMSVTYGLPTDSLEQYITHAEKTLEVIGRATVPGALLCDVLPFLKYLPSWTPFHRQACVGREMIEQLVALPFEHVKAEMRSGTAQPSLTRDFLTMEHNGISDFEEKVKWTSGGLFGGGETSFATVLTFILAMALHPSKQTRAQIEIDSVIGTGRMPLVHDAPNLPYVRCIIKETMRWHPVAPLGIAHRSLEDDIYRGFLIPKGTTVIPNIYSIATAANDKYDPRSFIPERFLDSGETTIDPDGYAFGFGRRICPGRYYAQNSVFIIISSILKTFTILPLKGETLIPRFTQNVVSYPEPFKCKIVPRSKEARDLVRTRVSDYELMKEGIMNRK